MGEKNRRRIKKREKMREGARSGNAIEKDVTKNKLHEQEKKPCPEGVNVGWAVGVFH